MRPNSNLLSVFNLEPRTSSETSMWRSCAWYLLFSVLLSSVPSGSLWSPSVSSGFWGSLWLLWFSLALPSLSWLPLALFGSVASLPYWLSMGPPVVSVHLFWNKNWIVSLKLKGGGGGGKEVALGTGPAARGDDFLDPAFELKMPLTRWGGVTWLRTPR